MADKIKPHETSRFRTATVILYFQKFPGKDSDSGISNVPYTYTVEGESDQKSGTTGKDGSIVLNFDPSKHAVLDIFGTKYNIRVIDELEKIGTPEGVQRRLNMLGYNAGPVNGVVGFSTELAILNFQAGNNPLRIEE